MEDVIFAGTSGRAPLGRAEVVLTIDNTDGALPIDYTEVTISRTMFRNGGSEYAINGHAARLLDVQDLLSDSGIGREMHVIVGQGQLDTILQATPESRRGFIEEAAGVLKHRKRKEKALRKLEACEGNLTRLSGPDQRDPPPAQAAGPAGRGRPPGRRDPGRRCATPGPADGRRPGPGQLALESDLADETADDASGGSRWRSALEHGSRRPRSTPSRLSAAACRPCPPPRRPGTRWPRCGSGWPPRSRSPRERMRTRGRTCPGASRTGRDPEELEREAERGGRRGAGAGGRGRGAEPRRWPRPRRTPSRPRRACRAEESRLAALLRAAADRREGLARLTGQVNTLRSRAEAGEAEIGRLTAAARTQAERAEQASRPSPRWRPRSPAWTPASSASTPSTRRRLAVLDAVEAGGWPSCVARSWLRRRSGPALAARVEALQRRAQPQGRARRRCWPRPTRSTGCSARWPRWSACEAGDETAIAAAFGAAADAVAVAGLDAALGAFGLLKTSDLGRAGLLARRGRTDVDARRRLAGAAGRRALCRRGGQGSR